MSQQTNWVPTSVDLEKPSAARSYDYLLGGNHNFEVDRDFVAQVLAVQPQVKRAAIMNRAFMRRVVLFLMEQGVRQFLDLGSGIPTVGNVHEIAHAIDPDTRVVYVDNEHVAVAHSQLLLENNAKVNMVHADITKPGLVLNDQVTKETLDFSKPIAILGVTIGHYVLEDAVGVFGEYRNAVAPGSYLALTHLTNDFIELDALTEAMKRSQNQIVARNKAEITELFGDWELLEPGLVMTSLWRPERDADSSEEAAKEDALYAGVARKN